jgi:hypothetical protein
MKTYARIANNSVAEILVSATNPSLLFHPALRWVDVTVQPSIKIGYVLRNNVFEPPPPPVPVSIQAPTLAQLQAELATLSAQIAAFSPNS